MSDRWAGTPFTPALVEEFYAQGWWGRESVSDLVGARAREQPTSIAYGDLTGPVLTWRGLDEHADRLADALRAAGVGIDEAVAVMLPDGPWLHVAYIAIERVGAVTVGVPARAARRELVTAIEKNRAVGLISEPDDGRAVGVAAGDERLQRLRWWCTLDRDGAIAEEVATAPPSAPGTVRARAPEEVFFVNTTSGTTGLPKAVAHNQHRWLRFARLAVEAGALGPEDRVLSLVPTPYGFGLWSTHMLPAVLGTPVFQLERWDADDALEVVQREGVTVMMAVTTQLLMLLDRASTRPGALRGIRAVFTGGERVPAERARQLEELSGGAVLQFYGSNEAGGVSATRVDDAQEDRLHTAGRVFEEMDVHLVGAGGDLVDERPGRGQVAVRGPMMCSGYVGEPEAMQGLLRDDGLMLLPDVAEIDARGYLTVVGRVSELIIRGGLNISVPAVESAVEEHPRVSAAVAVPVDDPVYSERVAAVVTLAEGRRLGLDELVALLEERGHPRSLWPERLVVVASLPIAVGGKVDRQLLRRVAGGEEAESVRVLARADRDEAGATGR